MTTTYKASHIAVAMSAVLTAQQLGPLGHGMGVAREAHEADFLQWTLGRDGRANAIDVGVADHPPGLPVRDALTRLGLVPHPEIDAILTLPNAHLDRTALIDLAVQVFKAYDAAPDEELCLFPADPERDPELIAPVIEACRTRGLHVWHGFPADAPQVLWPDSADLEGFLTLATDLRASVLYLGVVGDELLAGFAIAGVVHVLILHGTQRAEQNLDDEDEDDENASHTYSTTAPLFNPLELRRQWAEQSYQALPAHVRTVVDAAASDPRYDDRAHAEAKAVLTEHARDLTAEEFGQAEQETRTRFRDRFEPEIARQADQLALKLVAHADFDALDYTGEASTDILKADFFASDPRLLRRAKDAAQRLAHERGLAKQARADVEREARQLLEQIPVLTRDQAGFASRHAQREALLDPYLSDVPQRRRRRILQAMRDLLENSESQPREARYAAAARRLLAAGHSKAAVSRTLGITTGTVDRLQRGRGAPIELAPDDPIVTELAPELGAMS